MYDNKLWNSPQVVLYCQVGRSLDMAKFSIDSAISNSGLAKSEFDLFFICWKTSSQVYDWLNDNSFKFYDMQYDEGKGFLWNLYKGWNFGYKIGFRYADYVCPIATDHAFYKNWLSNMMKHAQPNRIVNCKLIEPGTLPTLHTVRNFGITIAEEFNETGFLQFAEELYRTGENKLVLNDAKYGHRLDAMPFVCPKDVWDKFGPMLQTLKDSHGTTGDTDFFNRCKGGNVEITKALDAISYHCGGLESSQNKSDGIYT